MITQNLYSVNSATPPPIWLADGADNVPAAHKIIFGESDVVIQTGRLDPVENFLSQEWSGDIDEITTAITLGCHT